EHDRAHDGDDRRIEQRARAHDPHEWPLAGLPAFDVELSVVSNQAGRATDLRHHGVAGVDAQATLDAAEIGAATDVDPGRAGVDALVAIDAVARRLAL